MLDRKNIIILLSIAILFIAATYFLFAAWHKPSLEIALNASNVLPIVDAELSHFGHIASNDSGDIQYGFIKFDNGDRVNFWFCGHHRCSDIGTTVFQFENEKILMSGYFCCEIMLPDEFSYSDSGQLRHFISKNNGVRP